MLAHLKKHFPLRAERRRREAWHEKFPIRTVPSRGFTWPSDDDDDCGSADDDDDNLKKAVTTIGGRRRLWLMGGSDYPQRYQT